MSRSSTHVSRGVIWTKILSEGFQNPMYVPFSDAAWPLGTLGGGGARGGNKSRFDRMYPKGWDVSRENHTWGCEDEAVDSEKPS